MAGRKKRLRKTLPKDIREQMAAAAESGDYRDVHAALEACEVDARGGYGNRTPLMMPECTPELARWLVERGVDVDAKDQYGNTALHESARARFGHKLPAAELIALGGDLHARNGEQLTPLHAAADGKHHAAVELLLSHGADAHAVHRGGLTPLAYALQRMNNIDLVSMVPVVRALLDAGTEVTPEVQGSMKIASKQFEFYRASFDEAHVEETADAAQTLCDWLGVIASPPRVMHDGTSPIVATSTTWQARHAELWDLLVPSHGPAATMQGEVVRISGRVADELHRNGGVNWDKCYRAMTHALCSHLASHDALSPSDVRECEALARTFPDNLDGASRLEKLAVKWVARNPAPISLPRPIYTR